MGRYVLFSVWSLVVIAACTATATAEGRQPGELFPVPEPLETGYLEVSDLHSIHYMLCGNPQGKPVFVLHGGPGVGFYPRLTRYFDPKKFLIVLHDQRGAGRSRPPGELRQNTTQDLVADIERLRTHLGIKGKIFVFGGSWGSTLALAYAEAHPDRVRGMVLRDIFTGTRNEIENAFVGPAVRSFFPDAVARLEAELPADFGEFTPRRLLKLLTEADDALVHKVGNAWIRLYVKTDYMHASDQQVERSWGDYDPRPAARIDCHYATNGSFLMEGQLLRNADKLVDIPVTIINGRYDMICPPITAWRLHQRLPRSKLVIVEEAGHSETEPGTTRALLEAVAEFE